MDPETLANKTTHESLDGWKPIQISTTNTKTPEQLSSETRMWEEKEKAAIRRDNQLFTFGFSLLAVVCTACLWVILRETYSTDTLAMAKTTITSIVAGFVGYLTGKQSKKDEK